MRRTADVVIVGGGVVGCSAAYHLAAAGAGAVLLLERQSAIGMGSTGACAGGFRHQFGSRVNIELSLASIPMIVGFADEHGLPLDVWRDGYLFLVRGEDLWRSFVSAAALQRSLGVDARLLIPEQAQELASGIALEGLVGAAYCPDDGIADPGGLTNGYAALARREGAAIDLGIDVTAIATNDGGVTGVRTAAGAVDAPVVVDAAGPWAAELARTAGIELPLEPIPRTVVTTGSFAGMPERRTLVIDAASSFYFHREGEGVLMGMGGRGERASFSTAVNDGFVTDELLPRAVEVFPRLADGPIRSTWAGLYEMTPDRHPVIGEAPVRGLYLANGFSGHGFQHAPIVGKLLAEMIVEGAARSVDVSSLGLERFADLRLAGESHVV